MMKIEEIVEKVVAGEISLHEIDNYLEANAAMLARRLAVEKLTGAGLPNVGSTIIDYAEIKNRNAENVIGATQIPLGVAGPIKVNGEFAKGNFLVPLATTEGALIASVNRGMKAISSAGGSNVRVIKDEMTRAPVIKLGSISDVSDFLSWLHSVEGKIKEVTESTSSHLKYKGFSSFIVGNNVWLRFSFETGNAMGMNMVTIASEKACSFIEENFPRAKCVAVSGNMCSDKKNTLVNSLEGRGKTVIADVLLPHEVVKSELKSDPYLIHEVNLRKNWLGSARAGSLSQFNAHFANIIAAIFIATGQDVAQVVESSSGYTWTEVRNDGLYVSVTLPSLEVGSVGGGTRLPTQREALSIMGIKGELPHSSKKLAEIIASSVLAGELNLLSALANKELGKAHLKLGRNAKP
ncbi:hydroxymethylglutaryl-CoA reductase (NADPH) [Sulfuracidifex metallicus]|uniref:hydroxymethylglutaryl-CoA reductase (NADPH) n=1 Tax=Sulfuracidifex metallicus TaxID=47303 RepID=UPI0022729DA4|nr:hydroxymethylglutaryl-CoA reductase (NADPH) [Sulfuracidifex metallicus]MCY0850081.1 hydroxymethylglutaryl-CoA reductase (NADPH) [Sulfuracidifex metallicus]